jgi:hypothetical protein
MSGNFTFMKSRQAVSFTRQKRNLRAKQPAIDESGLLQ